MNEGWTCAYAYGLFIVGKPDIFQKGLRKFRLSLLEAAKHRIAVAVLSHLDHMQRFFREADFGRAVLVAFEIQLTGRGEANLRRIYMPRRSSSPDFIILARLHSALILLSFYVGTIRLTRVYYGIRHK